MDNDLYDRLIANLMFELEAISSTDELLQNNHAQGVFGDRLLKYTRVPINQMKVDIRAMCHKRALARPMSVDLHVGQTVDAFNERRQSDPVTREEWARAIDLVNSIIDETQQQVMAFEETEKQDIQELPAKMRKLIPMPNLAQRAVMLSMGHRQQHQQQQAIAHQQAIQTWLHGLAVTHND